MSLAVWFSRLSKLYCHSIFHIPNQLKLIFREIWSDEKLYECRWLGIPINILSKMWTLRCRTHLIKFEWALVWMLRCVCVKNQISWLPLFLQWEKMSQVICSQIKKTALIKIMSSLRLPFIRFRLIFTISSSAPSCFIIVLDANSALYWCDIKALLQINNCPNASVVLCVHTYLDRVSLLNRRFAADDISQPLW